MRPWVARVAVTSSANAALFCILVGLHPHRRGPILTEPTPQVAPPALSRAASSLRTALLCVFLAATAVITPLCFRGDASGHDFLFHLASWMDVSSQWHEGIVYPRWAEWANWGFGEPRFVFYPPASWTLGAALGSLLPWRMAPGAFIWLALAIGGMSMWKLAREWLPGPPATAAAVLFAVNPYNLVIVYYRSDFSELLAVALLPLAVWGALRCARQEWRCVPPLAAAFAAIWLANAPAAVIATYSLALILVTACAVRRSLRPLLPGGIAMAGGFGLAAFYILPAAWEQRWVQIADVVADNVQPARNFLFTRSNDPEFMFFNWKVSWVALSMILVTGIAGVWAARKRREFGEIWWTLTALGAASVLLMFRPSDFVWRHLPKLQFLQFPWRWLDVLALVFACSLATAMNGMRKRAAWVVGVLLLAMTGAAATAMIEDAWWDSAGAPVLSEAIGSQRGYEGTDEYMPTGCDRSELPGNPDDETRQPYVSSTPAAPIEKFDAASGSLVPAKGVRLHIEQWSAEHKAFRADTEAPVTLALRLLAYPAWEVRVDGRNARFEEHPVTTQLLLPLGPGTHRVEVRFRRTWDRTAGGILSALTAMALLVFAGALRRRCRTRAA